MPVHISQPTVDAVVAERKFGMIDAQQVQDGRVDLVVSKVVRSFSSQGDRFPIEHGTGQQRLPR